MNFRKLMAFTVAAGLGSWAGAADATTMIALGISTSQSGPDVGTIVTGNSNQSGGVLLSNSIGGINFDASGQGIGNSSVFLPLVLRGSIGSGSASGGDAWIFITEYNITAPVTNGFNTAFTPLDLPDGWTATAYSYFDQGNTAFAQTTALFAAPLTQGGPCPSCSSQTASMTVDPITGAYSLTEVLHIQASGNGSSDYHLDIQAVPGPIVGAGLPGLLAACGSLLAFARRRRRRQAA